MRVAIIWLVALATLGANVALLTLPAPPWVVVVVSAVNLTLLAAVLLSSRRYWSRRE